MRVAEIAGIREAVPPLKYGGTEVVVSAVTEGLIKRGYDVTLFASGDSKTTAHLQSIIDASIGFGRMNERLADILLSRNLANVFRQAASFDLFHNHILETFAWSPYIEKPLVTTLHTDLARPEEQAILGREEMQRHAFVSISDAQRTPLPHLPYVRTIYHGLEPTEFSFQETPGDYLVFLGRVTPEKGVREAVETAIKTKRKLKMMGKIDEPLSDYAKEMVALFEQHPDVIEFIGEVGAEQKKSILAGAYAFLMPIQWEEPFGLVVIEALACGTPVIAMRRGSMPEIIRHGETGFLVDDVEGMVAAVANVAGLNRRVCRDDVEKRFTRERMVDEYAQLFEGLLAHPV